MKNNTVKVIETELIPSGPNARRSFYRKAFVLDDNKGTRYLRSYDVIICSVDRNRSVKKYAEAESATTTRHLKSFLYLFAPGTTSEDFKKLPLTEKRPKLHSIL